MASLFRNRKLLDTFPNRNVVGESTGVHTKAGDLVFRVAVDFGSTGKLTRYLTIKALGNDLVGVSKALREYENSILEIIDHLEEVERWAMDVEFTSDDNSPARNRNAAIFNRVLCEDNPLMFHLGWVNKGVSFMIFGKGLFDMEIRMGDYSPTSRRMFQLKVSSISDIFRDHLRDLEKLPVGQLLQKGAQ